MWWLLKQNKKTSQELPSKCFPLWSLCLCGFVKWLFIVEAFSVFQSLSGFTVRLLESEVFVAASWQQWIIIRKLLTVSLSLEGIAATVTLTDHFIQTADHCLVFLLFPSISHIFTLLPLFSLISSLVTSVHLTWLLSKSFLLRPNSFLKTNLSKSPSI